ncbi:serine/threonine protein kinase [Nocardia sp. GAS34]|uniref:serine/threonine protein kinase n=1 Tax=unclassified Nocardia TaxID=2637762 RepID=UPI003D23665D
MTDINGLPYYEIDFNADGTLNTQTGTGDGGLAAAVAGGITDLFVFAHGWNNGVASARDLYQAMFALLADQLGQHRSTSAAVGVVWPSLLFPDDDPVTAAPVASTGAQIAAALSPAFPAEQHQALTTLGNLLDQQPQDPAKLVEFHTLASGLVTTPAQGAEDTGEAALLTSDAATAFGHAAAMTPAPVSNAQGLGNPFSGLWSGAREVLRTLSYYEMKNRAGIIGHNGLGPLLAELNNPHGQLRIHLMGHSFGARLAAYTLAGIPADRTGAASPVKSLTLIQGAFSHFAFANPLPFDAGRSGGLADVVDRVDGPLLATFTAADRAVGWWYPAASMLARQDSQAASDLAYRWGGMGHDGYQQHTPAPITTSLTQPGTPYDFHPGSFYPLDANTVICADQSPFSGAHSDIRHPEVLWATVCAAGLDNP